MSCQTNPRLLVLFLAASSLLTASATPRTGRPFDDMVKAIEQRYGVRHTHIPLMGVANLITKAARPEGTTGFKLATFEGLEDRWDAEGAVELDQFMSGLAVSGLHPMVRTHSWSGREATYIYAADSGRSIKLVIATFERSEATLIEVNVSTRILLQLLESPDHAAKMFGVGND